MKLLKINMGMIHRLPKLNPLMVGITLYVISMVCILFKLCMEAAQ
jgi:hypothetical protein